MAVPYVTMTRSNLSHSKLVEILEGFNSSVVLRYDITNPPDDSIPWFKPKLHFSLFNGSRVLKMEAMNEVMYCPTMFGHFSPAPVKTDRMVRIQ